MCSMPLTCCSIGAATVSATTWALAPGYWIETCTPGGTTCGYCAIGSVKTEIAPASAIASDKTVAKIGRSMKKRVSISLPLGTTERRHIALLHRHLRIRSDLLNGSDGDPVVRRQSAVDHAQ